MLLYLIKLCITLTVILASAEVAKRSPTLGAFIVVLPLVSILSMTKALLGYQGCRQSQCLCA